MKWGKRKAKIKSSVNKRRSQNKQIKSIKKKRKQNDRLRSTLSNKELDRQIKRLEKEEKLHNLTKNNVTKGKTETKKILSRVGTTLLTTALVGAGTYAINKTGLSIGNKFPKTNELMSSLTRGKK